MNARPSSSAQHALVKARLLARQSTGARRQASDADPNLSEHAYTDAVEIDAALTRLKDGTWGECESCAAPIGQHRLEAIPEARRCIDCETVENAARARLGKPG